MFHYWRQEYHDLVITNICCRCGYVIDDVILLTTKEADKIMNEQCIKGEHEYVR